MTRLIERVCRVEGIKDTPAANSAGVFNHLVGCPKSGEGPATAVIAEPVRRCGGTRCGGDFEKGCMGRFTERRLDEALALADGAHRIGTCTLVCASLAATA